MLDNCEKHGPYSTFCRMCDLEPEQQVEQTLCPYTEMMTDFYCSPSYDPNAARPADTVLAAIRFTMERLITDERVELAARALWFDFVDQHGYPNSLPTWDELPESIERRVLRSLARAVLTACFDRPYRITKGCGSASTPEGERL